MVYLRTIQEFTCFGITVGVYEAIDNDKFNIVVRNNNDLYMLMHTISEPQLSKLSGNISRHYLKQITEVK